MNSRKQMMCIRLFGETAKEEGFLEVASAFFQIARGRKTSREKICQSGKTFGGWFLFSGGKRRKMDVSELWAYPFRKQVPEICPLCRHARGYFIPLSLAPYIGALTGSEMEE